MQAQLDPVGVQISLKILNSVRVRIESESPEAQSGSCRQDGSKGREKKKKKGEKSENYCSSSGGSNEDLKDGGNNGGGKRNVYNVTEVSKQSLNFHWM